MIQPVEGFEKNDACHNHQRSFIRGNGRYNFVIKRTHETVSRHIVTQCLSVEAINYNREKFSACRDKFPREGRRREILKTDSGFYWILQSHVLQKKYKMSRRLLHLYWQSLHFKAIENHLFDRREKGEGEHDEN